MEQNYPISEGVLRTEGEFSNDDLKIIHRLTVQEVKECINSIPASWLPDEWDSIWEKSCIEIIHRLLDILVTMEGQPIYRRYLSKPGKPG